MIYVIVILIIYIIIGIIISVINKKYLINIKYYKWTMFFIIMFWPLYMSIYLTNKIDNNKII